MRISLPPLKRNNYKKSPQSFGKKKKKKEEKIVMLEKQKCTEDMINVISSSRYKLDRSRIRKLVSDILVAKGISETIIVNLIFVGRNKMKKLSETYKKESETLPVLSFTYDEKNKDEEVLLGEIVICYPQAVLLAAERNRRVEETIMTLIKHGIDNLLK